MLLDKNYDDAFSFLNLLDRTLLYLLSGGGVW